MADVSHGKEMPAVMTSIDYAKPLTAHTTAIPGLTVFEIPVHGDNRGWFKENWQQQKMTAVGMPDFGPHRTK